MKLEFGQLEIPSGYVGLDNITGGLARSGLIIIAGAPDMEVSCFLRNIMLRIEADSILFYDLRRSAGTPPPALRAGVRTIRNNHLCLKEIIANTFTWHNSMRNRAGAIFVDCVQNLILRNETESGVRYDTIRDAARELKILARRLDLPVVAVSRVNHNRTYQARQRPELVDLMDAGSLEDDADVVIFLTDAKGWQLERRDLNLKPIDAVVKKQRHGPTGSFRLAMDTATGIFYDVEDGGQYNH